MIRSLPFCPLSSIYSIITHNRVLVLNRPTYHRSAYPKAFTLDLLTVASAPVLHKYKDSNLDHRFWRPVHYHCAILTFSSTTQGLHDNFQCHPAGFCWPSLLLLHHPSSWGLLRLKAHLRCVAMGWTRTTDLRVMGPTS